MSDALPLLVVFGATGSTGTHLVKHALAEGTLRVRAYVRSPNKLPEETSTSPNFEIVKGDFSNYEGVVAACEGASYAISVAGNAPQSKKGPFMVPFVKALIEGCEKHGVERVLYQAGALSPAPGQKPSLLEKMLRVTVAPMMGIGAMVKENDRAIEMFNESKLTWICPRPGALRETPSRGVLKTSPTAPGTGVVAFIDLAKYNLVMVRRSSEDCTAPYVFY